MSHLERLSSWLGLAPETRRVHVVAALSTSAASISLLVFMSVSTPFVVTDLVDVDVARPPPRRDVGDVTARLILADELTALGLYLPIGCVSDRHGVRVVASAAYFVVASACVLYVQCRTVSHLIFARILFAMGAAGLVNTISATLSSLITVEPIASDSVTAVTNEREPLLNVAQAGPGTTTPTTGSNTSARLAGLMGFSSGVGALVAVFGYLRLPSVFSRLVGASEPDALTRGLVYTFYAVAALACAQGLFVFYALPRHSGLSIEPGVSGTGYRKALYRLAKRLGTGFVVARRNRNVALALVTSFATRAQAVVVTAVIPLLVNRFFHDHDLCTSLSSPSSGGVPTNGQSCRQAYVSASVLTGVVQLVTLVLSPLVGLVSASSCLARRRRQRQRRRSTAPHALVLAASFLVATVSSVAFASYVAGPGPGTAEGSLAGDPRRPIVAVFAVGFGIAQAAGTVVSLALVADARAEIAHDEQKEVAGGLSSASSFAGGVGILVVGSAASRLFDSSSRAPFWLLASVNLAVTAASLAVWASSELPT